MFISHNAGLLYKSLEKCIKHICIISKRKLTKKNLLLIFLCTQLLRSFTRRESKQRTFSLQCLTSLELPVDPGSVLRVLHKDKWPPFIFSVSMRHKLLLPLQGWRNYGCLQAPTFPLWTSIQLKPLICLHSLTNIRHLFGTFLWLVRRCADSREWKSLSCVRLLVTPWAMEFSRPEHWTGYPFPSPGDLPNPGIEPRSPALQADSLPAEPQGKPQGKLQGDCWQLGGVHGWCS